MAKINPEIGNKYKTEFCIECLEKINKFHEENPKFRSRVYLALHSRKYFKKIILLICDSCKVNVLSRYRSTGGR